LQEKKYISIGKITKPIGLKGYVKVLILTDFPDRFKSLKSIVLFDERENSVIIDKFSNSEKFYIKDVLYEMDFVKILFENYEDVNSVKNLIGCFLVLEENERMNLEKGNHYYYELIGLEVINEGKMIGHTISIENYGGRDLFKIKLIDNNKEVLIPYVPDFIKHIDTVNKFIEIDVIDGMLN
jgi:16S rRNA processing protein RimM